MAGADAEGDLKNRFYFLSSGSQSLTAVPLEKREVLPLEVSAKDAAYEIQFNFTCLSAGCSGCQRKLCRDYI